MTIVFELRSSSSPFDGSELKSGWKKRRGNSSIFVLIVLQSERNIEGFV